MVKVRKDNVVYTLVDSEVKRFLQMGYVIIDEVTSQPASQEVVDELFAEPAPRKNLYHMNKQETYEYAVELGISINGDEKTNVIKEKIKEVLDK